MNPNATELLTSQALPEPIADLYLAYLRETARTDVDWMRRFHRMLDLFEVCVAYGALVVACDIVQSADATLTRRGGVETLRRTDAASIGTWWRILDTCLRDQSSQQVYAPSLLTLVDRRTGLGGLLDAIPGVRNSMRGHAFTLPEGSYRSAVESHADLLLATVRTFEAPAMPSLARVLAHEGAETVVEFRMGSSWRHEVVRLDVRDRIGVGECVLLRTAHAGPATALRLHPFLLRIPVDETTGLDQLALYQGRQGKHALYLPTRVAQRFQEKDGAAAVDARLQTDTRVPGAVRERTSRDRKLRVGDIVDAASRVGEAFLASARRERVYVPEAYVERPRLQPAIRAWQLGDPSLLLVAGAAGSGKSSLLCRLVEAWPDRVVGDLVVPRSAASLPTTGVGLGNDLARSLGLDETIEVSLDRWREAHGTPAPRVVLLVDGIDRAEDPAALVAACDVVASRGVHVLATIAGPVLDGLEARGVVAGLGHLCTASLEHTALRLTPLDGGEVADAYERYRSLVGSAPLTPLDRLPRDLRGAMSNPLLLRVTCEVHDGSTIAPETTEVDVLVAHARKSVFADPSRQDFTRRLVRILAGARVRRLPMSRLLAEDALRVGILDPSGPYQALLRDHVLVEHAGRSTRFGLAPEVYVEFTFDAMLGYLLLVEATERPDVSLYEVALAMLANADTFTPSSVAVDFAVRVSTPDERARILSAMLDPAAGPAGVKAVARALIWLGHVAPVRLADVARRRLDAAGITAGYVAADLAGRILAALDMDVEETPPADAAGATGDGWGRLVESPIATSILLAVVRSLIERRSVALAGACADLLLERRRDDLSPREAREASLVLAEALVAEGTRPALHTARLLTTPWVDAAALARDPSVVRQAMLLHVCAARALDDTAGAAGILKALRAQVGATAAECLEVVFQLAMLADEEEDVDGFRRAADEAYLLAQHCTDAVSRRRRSELASVEAEDTVGYEPALERLLADAQASGEVESIVDALLRLSWFKADRAPEQAERHAREALRLTADHHLVQAGLSAQNALGVVRSVVGDVEQANAISRAVVRSSLAMGDLYGALLEMSNAAVDAFDDTRIHTLAGALAWNAVARSFVHMLPDPEPVRRRLERMLVLAEVNDLLVAGDVARAARALPDDASTWESDFESAQDVGQLYQARVRLALLRGDAEPALNLARAAWEEASASTEDTAERARRDAAVLLVEAGIACGRPLEFVALVEEEYGRVRTDVSTMPVLDLSLAAGRAYLAKGDLLDARRWASRAVGVADARPTLVGAFRAHALLHRILVAEAEQSIDSHARAGLQHEAGRVRDRAHASLLRDADHRGDARLRALWLCNDGDARYVRGAMGHAAADLAERDACTAHDESPARG